MKLTIPESMAWGTVARKLRSAAPEAFADDGQPLNCVAGAWGQPGHGRTVMSPNDGTALGRLPMLDVDAARSAVSAASGELRAWAATPIDERAARARKWAALMREHRALLALAVAWEIGKTIPSATSDADRCIEGVEWYADRIGAMMDGRRPLGLVSNIASWNYPLSVLAHACVVQAMAGNPVIAKTPTDGGAMAITLAFALARRCGLPLSLISGSGSQLAPALVRGDEIACFSFVGGKTVGRDIIRRTLEGSKRYMLEMEGVNAYAVWDFSRWDLLAAQLKKGFEFGKQRCTAYVRFVVQRSLLPAFLDMYLPLLKSLRIGHPLAAAGDGHEPQALEFGPLINPGKIEELEGMIDEASHAGALTLYRGRLDDARFVAGQDRSAYQAPVLLANVPRNCGLYYNEPFGPVDTIVVVDSIDQLVDEMNVSNGNLVASIATDDAELGERVKSESRAFKFGINQVRSRGDKDEPFGGRGQSWRGCFVGGAHLVRAVTSGPDDDKLAGNFTDRFIGA